MFFEIAFRDATSGCMGKGEEGSVGDVKILEEDPMENLEDKQEEQFKGEDGFEFGLEMFIQVPKKTSHQIVYQDQNFSIEKLKLHVFFQNDKHNNNTRLFCKKT